MGQDGGVSLSLVSAVGRLIGAPRHRRELARYGRHAVTRPTAALAALVDGLVFRRPGGGWPPPGLSWPPTDHPRSPTSPARLPLRIDAAAGGGPPLALPLATRSWDLAGGAPWQGTFEDPEDRFAAHRFAWTLPLLRTHGAAAGPVLIDLATRWVGEHPPDPGAPGWDAYSIAERIAHWSYLLALAGDRPASARLLDSIRVQAAWLRQRPELRGASTNNHLINDGRALYHAGVLFGDAGFADAGRRLVDYGADRMFVDGFLREGSSHYHLLLCRTFLELWVLARAAGDDAWAGALEARADAMLQAAGFLVTPAGLPLFGDLSPDLTPAFLLSLARPGPGVPGDEGPPQEGWAGLLFGERGEGPPDRAAARSGSYAGAGYHRAVSGGWTVSAYANPLGHVAAWSHGHADLGSFVLDWRQTPVLVDCGRSTYAASSLSDYGRSVRSHNAVSIDRHEPCVAHGLNGFVPVLARCYYHRPPRVDLSTGSPTVRLRIAHDGFGRLGDGLATARTVTLDPGRCDVRDRIDGRGRHAIETFFHFHPDVAVSLDEPSVARCELPDGTRLRLRVPDATRCELVRGQRDPEPGGWYAGRYGDVRPCWTLRCDVRAALPLEQHYELVPV